MKSNYLLRELNFAWTNFHDKGNWLFFYFTELISAVETSVFYRNYFFFHLGIFVIFWQNRILRYVNSKEISCWFEKSKSFYLILLSLTWWRKMENTWECQFYAGKTWLYWIRTFHVASLPIGRLSKPIWTPYDTGTNNQELKL